jgi:CRP/FNR family transcriptional regulator, cyclic AMP receptor protein
VDSLASRVLITFLLSMRTPIATWLQSVHNSRTTYAPSDTIFAQGDRCAAVMYLEKGRVTLTATSPGGRQAVVATVRAGAFFGEGALGGQRVRRSTAQAMTASTIRTIRLAAMRRGLHDEQALSALFRRHMLARNLRIEADIVVQLANSTEKRLARALLLLAGVDDHQSARYSLPMISRTVLAAAIGAPRSRVDLLMNKFRKLGFLEHRHERDGGLRVHRSMLSVVLQD